MKRPHFLLLALPLVSLTACGGGNQEPDPSTATDTTAVAAGAEVRLGVFDVPLRVELGDLATLGVDSPRTRWNEEFGHIEVNAGEHFGLIITEEEPDIARLKADLDRDMLRKHTIIEETPEKLVYRSQFPDEDLVFVHFYQVVRVIDRTFIIEDRAEGRFNEADIARMSGAVSAVQPI